MSTNAGPRWGVRAATQRRPARRRSTRMMSRSRPTSRRTRRSGRGRAPAGPGAQRCRGARPATRPSASRSSPPPSSRYAVGDAGAGGECRTTQTAGDLGPAFRDERRRLLVPGSTNRRSACTAPSYKTNRWPPDSVNITSTPCRCNTSTREPSPVRFHTWLPDLGRVHDRCEEPLHRRRTTRQDSRTEVSGPLRERRRVARPGIVCCHRVRGRPGTASSCSPTITSVGQVILRPLLEVFELVRLSRIAREDHGGPHDLRQRVPLVVDELLVSRAARATSVDTPGVSQRRPRSRGPL